MNGLKHVLLCSLIALPQCALVVRFAWLPFWPDLPGSTWAKIGDWGAWSVHTEYLVYGAILAATTVVQLLRRQREQDVAEIELVAPAACVVAGKVVVW